MAATFLQRILTTILFILISTQLTFASSSISLSSEPVVKEKLEIPLTSAAKSFLKERDQESAIIWVFFTDKGLFDKAGFQKAASEINFSEKVLWRRAKSGINEILFSDLPVKENYVAEIINLGAELRNRSKWLNAASFEVPFEKLDQIELLPFVFEIKPVSRYTKPVIDEANYPSESIITQPLGASSIDYGSAWAQLTQINVPQVHNMGLSGKGVTLAILDTGYRKSHDAFASHYAQGHVLGEYDFIFNDGNTSNEAVDASTQWNHGTSVWSLAAGNKQGEIVGPAYNANFLLAKTEDVRSETVIEEDNWARAAEWADSAGADVITSSLGYSDWYNYADYDGQTAITTIAANTAVDLGIVVCISMGNSGPASGTLTPPADAFENISVGAVTSTGGLANFSSRGPTFDGRIKPEVCARGVSDAIATASGNNTYSSGNGTSYSTPLVAGVACLILEQHPNYPPQLVRRALMESADNTATPDNNFGWGIVDALGAVNWGANFSADVTTGEAPMLVQFTDLSTITVYSYLWDFGDGTTSNEQNPQYLYNDPGVYHVSLSIETDYGLISNQREAYIIAMGDTLIFVNDSAFAGDQAVMSVLMTNSMVLDRITIPFRFLDTPKMELDSVSFGERTSYFELKNFGFADDVNRRYVVNLYANNGGLAEPLPPGSGEIAKLFFTLDRKEIGGLSTPVDTLSVLGYYLKVFSQYAEFTPEFYSGTISTVFVIRGDVDYSLDIDISDLTFLVRYMFMLGDEPVTFQTGDINGDQVHSVLDLTYMVDYMFNNGAPPPTP